jgi:hypothetical protein
MPVAQSRVFIAHSPPERELAQRLAKAIGDELGYGVIASTWTSADGDEMQQADVVVVLGGPSMLEHEFMSAYRHALEAQIGRARIVTVRVGPVLIELPLDPDAPRSFRLVDANADLGGVVARIRGLVEGEEPPEEPPPEPLRLSRSVESATGEMADRPVATADIVEAILKLHGEYGDGLGRLMSITEPPRAERRPAVEWLATVRALFREEAVETLHGRTVIRGLGLLDPELTKQLLAHGFLSELEGELDPPLLDSLTPEGYRLWEPGDVPTLGDRPARVDRLHRRQFAGELAEMVDDERRRSTAESGGAETFLVHLHGPWGSGKTSLLGFLGEALEKAPTPWVVVSFNAWQQERLGAPWWSLMTAVQRAGKRMPFHDGLAWKLPWDRQRLRDLDRSLGLLWWELVWRIKLGWMAYLLLPVVVVALWYGWKNGFFDAATNDDGWLTQAGDIAKPVAAVVGLGAALLGAARGLSRSLSVGSARGADTFLKSSKDPMRTLRKRFERVVGTIGRPIVVFVDDLDRCQSRYVVEVLQGIQTLLIDAPVTYVVAADRRWLYDSYAKVYRDFGSVAREPGRPLGHLFLEKTFQLSASLPQLDPATRASYWRGLIVPGEREPEDDPALLRKAAKRIASAGLSQALREVDASAARPEPEARALRQAVASRLRDADVEEEIRYRLVPFAALLESNPRAMKRLINAYRIELRRMLAEGRQVGSSAVTPEQLALWTILSMRWPILADWLAAHPGVLESERDDPAMGDLRDLWVSDPVRAVVTGEGVPAALTESAVRAVVGLERKRRSPAAPMAPGNGQGAVA